MVYAEKNYLASTNDIWANFFLYDENLSYGGALDINRFWYINF